MSDGSRNADDSVSFDANPLPSRHLNNQEHDPVYVSIESEPVTTEPNSSFSTFPQDTQRKEYSSKKDTSPNAGLPFSSVSHEGSVQQGSSAGDQRTDAQREASDQLFAFPDPPADWAFNIFLGKLADSLTAEDLSKVKRLFAGEGGIGKGVLEKMKTPSDLFQILQQRCYLNRYNLLFLQSALFWIGRIDLVKLAVEYARDAEDVLHFFSPTYEPENGYRIAKFHVAGKDFTKFSRQELERLRAKVSCILQVPEKFVLITGIEPTASIVVTFMIPVMYVDILSEMLQSSTEIKELSDAGVDFVDIPGYSQYKIQDKDRSKHSTGPPEMASLYQQLQNANKHLDDAEVNFLETCRKLENCESALKKMEKKLNETKAEKQVMRKLLMLTKDENQPASLQELAAFREFTMILDQLGKENVDRAAIANLIASTIDVMARRIKESHRLCYEQLLLKLQDMQTQLLPLQLENARLGFVTNIYNWSRLAGASIEVQVPLRILPHDLEASILISKELSSKEKDKLKSKYTWTPDDHVAKFMGQDPSLFLAGIYRKEIERTRQFVEFETFMRQCLTEVNRNDLLKCLKVPESPSSPTQRENRQRQSRPQPFQFFQGPQMAGHATSERNIREIIETMARQMQEMYELITAKRNIFGSDIHDWKTPPFAFNTPPFPSAATRVKSDKK